MTEDGTNPEPDPASRPVPVNPECDAGLAPRSCVGQQSLPGVPSPPDNAEPRINGPANSETIAVLLSIALFDFFLYRRLGATGFGLLMFLWSPLLFLSVPHRRQGAALPLTIAMVLGLRGTWQPGLLTTILPPLFLAIALAIARTKADHWLDALAATGHARVHLKRLTEHVGNVQSWTRNARGGPWRDWLIPVTLTCLAIGIFGSIFVAANPVIERAWEEITVLFRLSALLDWLVEFMIPSPTRVLFWLIAAAVTTVLIAPAASAILPRIEDQVVREGGKWSDTIARSALMILAAACLLFAVYIAVDINYLFIRSALPDGITDSTYARRGTFWLTLALALSTLCIGAATAESQLSSRWTRVISRLAQFWVGLDILMAACVLGRIHYYIDISGLTPLRMAGVFGTLIVIAGLALIGMKVSRRKNLLWLLRRYTVAFLAGLALFTLLPRDTLCSLYNVARVRGGDIRPLVLLFRASMPVESLPEYLALLDHPDPVIARGLSAYLAERWKAVRGSRQEVQDWRQWRLARERAISRMEAAAPRFVLDQQALDELATACGGFNEATRRPMAAWSTGERSDLEWLDD